MPLAKANGTTLHYRFDGPDTGDVIMFSNSLATNLFMWDDQVSPLCEAGYRVLRYDTRGHGQSFPPLPGPILSTCLPRMPYPSWMSSVWARSISAAFPWAA